MLEVFNQLDDLQEVWLGDCYPVEFYKNLPAKTYDGLAYLTDQTKTDLDKVQRRLQELGVTVRRPNFSTNSDDHRDAVGNLLKPPICPRDDNIVIGQTLYHLRNRHRINPWHHELALYRGAGCQVIQAGRLEKFGYIEPPSIVRLGSKLIICRRSHDVSWHLMERDVLPQWQTQFEIVISDTGGHTDAVYAPVKEGYVLGSHWMQKQHDELTGWQVHKIRARPPRIPKQWTDLPGHENAWWIEGIDEPGELYLGINDFIQQKAQYWIGNAAETVFEVNCLVINRGLVMTTGEPDLETRRWFASIDVDYIPMPVRSRSFWDGGLHCMTCDIMRKPV